MSKIDHKPGADALAFLVDQHLSPTPENYTLAYMALADPGSPIGRMVEAFTSEGFRLRQSDADEIIRLHLTRSVRGAARQDRTQHDALRHQALKLGEAASSAAAATGAFARELSAEAGSFGEGETRTVEIVARMIERSQSTASDLDATASEVAALRLELETARDDAQRDQLTGLGNRRAIDRHLQRLSNKGSPRVVGLCDIDFFKSINDRYGHGVGDRVLKQVASSLSSACAPHFVGRWGGEEFLVVMESDDAAAGVALLDQARADLAKREFKLRENDQPMGQITFSGGVATATGDHADSIAAIHRADAALYRAKAEGRNRICSD
ncbi:GGDEF domain-containing protein [Qipengyuania sp. DY56-A-20]|jgi:diguanylate cyclase|uniref:diguanylate cyclase n=1 Tax=Qipengyuania benthica TaxID=3067651 RepID=A0ABT9H546_9SPHN|nr:GGDEF domain-containing protein [Qipengyuania sp. DY56-A-20]MDP4538441.1 GGDEF domain-containing protein [Qipengyuania sp. DY56-A-20]